MKKYISEMIGTMVLVLMGCGCAIFNGGCGTTAQVLTVAFAFGLSVVAMAYAIGGISGCHINPAITLGCWLSGRMKGGEALMYMVFQVIGAIIGYFVCFCARLCRRSGRDNDRSKFICRDNFCLDCFSGRNGLYLHLCTGCFGCNR